MEREEKESEGRRRSACCRTDRTSHEECPSGKIVSTPALISWDGPSSHGAYSVRGIQETNHKTVFLRGTYCRSRNCKST